MKRRGLAHGLLAIAAVVALSGCAQLVVAGDGSRHLLGCMAVSLPPVEGDIGADSVRMRTLGLAIVRGDVVGGGSIVLGYSDTTLAAVRNNSLVSKALLLDPQGIDRPPPGKP